VLRRRPRSRRIGSLDPGFPEEQFTASDAISPSDEWIGPGGGGAADAAARTKGRKDG